MEFDSILVQGAHKPSENRNCITVPIYQTSAFSFDTVQYAADLFDLKCPGDIYSRITNPTVQVLEERLAALEGGVGALCVTSGQSATTLSILNLAGAGDEIVASSTLYGGTYNLFNSTLRNLGINFKFVDCHNMSAIETAITDKTKAVFVEMVGNPKLDIPDIERIAEIAHKHNIPLIVDNTVSTPYLFNPFKHGADIVVHSLTKYISGHGNVLGGAIVDSGNFDWIKSGKFSQFTEPDNSYHGLVYAETFGNAAYIVRARTNLMRDIGCCLSANNASTIIVGLETLHLRMQRHSDSAAKVVEFLQQHPAVEWVNYPLSQTSPDYELAKKYLPKGASSLVTFGLKNGAEMGIKLIEKVKLFIHATNIGDARSIITYPCLTTHRQMNDEELKACGISKNFIRLSVGLEDPADIINDLEQALS